MKPCLTPIRPRGVAWRVGLACVAGLLSACASDKPSGYGLMPGNAARAEMMASAAAADAGTPDTPGMYRGLIERMQAQGLFFASLAHISQFELQYGVTPDSTLMRARALRETGQLDVSAAAYRSLIDGPRAGAAWHGLGLIAGARSDYANAANALAEAARRMPTDALVLNDHGYALMRAGQVAAARTPLAQAAELDAGNAKIIANMAVYLRVTGEDARAEAVMTRASLTPATRTAVLRLSDTIRDELATARRPAAPAGTDAGGARPATAGAEDSIAWARPMSPLLERFGAEPK